MFFFYRLLAGILICLIIVALNLLIKWNNKYLYKPLLGAGLIGLSWFIFIFIYYLPQHSTNYSTIFWASIPIYFLPAPLFYVCVTCYFDPERRLSKKHLVHLLDILLIIMFFAGSNFYESKGSGINKIAHVYYLCIIQTSVYLFYQWFIILLKYSNESFKAKKGPALVLNTVLSLLLTGHVYIAIHLLHANHDYSILGDLYAMKGYLIITIIALAIFCFCFFYRTDLYGNSIKEPVNGLAAAPIPEMVTKEPEPEQISDRQVDWLPADLSLEDCCNKLEQYMEHEKPWLHKRINLQTMASNLGFSAHILSAIVNKQYQMNYNDFINKYRIQYIHEMVKTNPLWKTYTLETIATEAGFSSRTACYNAFKKNTGMSLGNYIETLTGE